MCSGVCILNALQIKAHSRWPGFAATTSNADANVGQIGLGVTVH